jgi:hypothetical protein
MHTHPLPASFRVVDLQETVGIITTATVITGWEAILGTHGFSHNRGVFIAHLLLSSTVCVWLIARNALVTMRRPLARITQT